MKSCTALTAIVAILTLIHADSQLASAQQGPQVTLSADSLNFGQVVLGQQPALGVFATNTGDAPLIFTAVSATAGFSADNVTTCFQYNPFAPGAGCDFGATFVGTTPGIYNGVLTLTDNAPDSPQSITLSAKATALEFSPKTILFGTYAPGQTSAARKMTIVNVWDTTVNISNVSFSGANAVDFLISNQTCVTALAANASCSFDVTFAPTVLANETAALTVTDDEPGGPDAFQAFGDGTYLQMTPRLLHFTTSPQDVTLTNIGDSIITIANIAIAGPGFDAFLIGGTTCGQTIAPGASCTVSVGLELPGLSTGLLPLATMRAEVRRRRFSLNPGIDPFG